MSIPSANTAIVAAQRMLESIQNEADIVRAINDDDPKVGGLPLTEFHKQNMVRVQLMAHAWRKIGRQILAMDPQIVEEVRCNNSDKIPGLILRHMPYLNPLVTFADPPVFDTWLSAGQAHPITGQTETSMKLLGFLTSAVGDGLISEDGDGRVRIEQRIFPTSSTEADRFMICLVLESLDELGRGVGIEFNTVTICFDKKLTFAETVDDVLSRFHWDDQDLTRTKAHRKWMREVMSVVIGSLFYCCSTTLEAEKVPPRWVAKKMPKRVVRAPISFYKIGWTTGAALTRLRAQRRSAWKESEQSDPAHEQDPQHRRAYMAIRWHGPKSGPQVPILTYVDAYWTKLHLLGESGTNTAHGVPSMGRGESRESMETVREVGTLLDDEEE